MKRHSAPLTWFEIPTKDIEAAKTFYETALKTTLKREDTPQVRMAIFPRDEGTDVGGCLREGRGLEPRDHGAVVYLRVPDTMEATVARWTEGGGRAVTPVLELPNGIGRIVQVLDAEGGRVALHEPGAAAA